MAVTAIDAASARHDDRRTRSFRRSPTDALDTAAQPGGRRFAGEPLVDQLLECLDALGLGRECRLLVHLLRDAQRVGGIKLTIDVSMDQQHGVIVRL